MSIPAIAAMLLPFLRFGIMILRVLLRFLTPLAVKHIAIA